MFSHLPGSPWYGRVPKFPRFRKAAVPPLSGKPCADLLGRYIQRQISDQRGCGAAEIEEVELTERTAKKGRFGLTLGVVIAAIVLIIFFASGRIRAQRARVLAYNQCIEQYDATLRAAKDELSKGDRNDAINSLLAARAQLNRCGQIPSGPSMPGLWRY